jgi:hypothetical protein
MTKSLPGNLSDFFTYYGRQPSRAELAVEREVFGIFATANPSQYSRAEQADLIRSAGLVLIQEMDVSGEYRRIQQALYDANARHAPALRRQLGGEFFEERQRNRRRTLTGIDRGVLRRGLFVAERPRRGSR